MYINMTPDKTNKTLHASQDDTIRQFKFKLVNDSQVLDTSDSIPPVIYDVEPNGIEQLLPVNSSTPTTSPIIADIKYPDELREDQEFFERITPTTLKGQAKVEKIKGNTIVWNQLVQNGNFADNSNWTSVGSATINSISNNTINVTTTATAQSGISNFNITMVQGHKYLLVGTVKTTWLTYISISGVGNVLFNTNSFVTKSNIFTWTSASGSWTCFIRNWDAISATFEAKNIMLIDLTQMFGSGNEPTSVDEFTSLFPLSYYDYNAGSLLSFNGTGLKSTGKNLLDVSQVQVGKAWNNANNSARATLFLPVSPNTTYTLLIQSMGTVDETFILQQSVIGSGGTNFSLTNANKVRTFTTESDTYFLAIQANKPAITYEDYISLNWQLEFGSTATDYEPYTENTIDLPISTYFPNGMKSAGTIYDELTKSKAITRIGVVDLGTLDWIYNTNYGMYTRGISSLIKTPSSAQVKANIVCANRIVGTWSQVFNGGTSSGLCGVTTTGEFGISTTETNPETFKSAMSGVYLYYELNTPTEEDIESYSLVSEDIEKPLEYNDGFLVCDSDGLTSKSGFIPCKIKKVKGDETLYSQLINLHVERKP